MHSVENNIDLSGHEIFKMLSAKDISSKTLKYGAGHADHSGGVDWFEKVSIFFVFA